MERETSLNKAKEIMGENFIGLEEFLSIKKEMGIHIPENTLETLPLVDFPEDLLERCKNDYLLILGIPFYKDGSELTIVKMRDHFGCNPEKSEPCFYNQDWYIKEYFAKNMTLDFQWYLVKKNVFEEYRGMDPGDIIKNLKTKQILPSAILCAFTFFSYYFLRNEYIWKNDFVWCSDLDCNKDQIYIGRYFDSNKINKNGFNIHRYLSLKDHYSAIVEIKH